MSKKKYLIPKNISDHVLMIGVYWQNHAPGGISSVVNEYADNFETFKYVVTAASRDDNKLKKMYDVLSGLLIFVFRLVFDRQIKIVHVQGSHGASFDRKKVFVKIAKRFGRKVIWHMHASQFVPFYESRKDKASIVSTLNKADKLIVLSSYYAEFYKSIGVDEDRIVTLNNIVPYPRIEIQKSRYENKLRLLFLGEISRRKGVFDLVQAIRENQSLAEQIEIRIGGNGETEKLKDLIHDAGLTKCIKFEGWVSGEKKNALLNWADVYILPSYNEGLPISILEALSYNCPVISTPVGGVEEVVKDERRMLGTSCGNGRIVTPGNTHEIADAIQFYVEHCDAVIQHGKVSGNIVKAYYPDSVFSQLRMIYTELLPE